MDDINCHGICHRLDRCVKICDKLKSAPQTSTKFPCVAAGYCPAVDEFGPMPNCKYKFPTSCSPSNVCQCKNMHCQLSEGYKQWHRMDAMLTQNLGALTGALSKMPKCGETGAHAIFCINEPVGLGMYCKQGSYLLCFYACVWYVLAIESPGGDDDRQWLSFWIIFLIFTVFEAVTDVLLSWMPSYFEAKLAFLCCLVFWNGVDVLYHKVHKLPDRVAKTCEHCDVSSLSRCWQSLVYYSSPSISESVPPFDYLRLFCPFTYSL